MEQRVKKVESVACHSCGGETSSCRWHDQTFGDASFGHEPKFVPQFVMPKLWQIVSAVKSLMSKIEATLTNLAKK